MFQRLHGNKEYSGTGIGLAIAKKVVENHHGYIKAEGEEGKGAVFHLLWPK
jgi:signal transduction histidine kinase